MNRGPRTPTLGSISVMDPTVWPVVTATIAILGTIVSAYLSNRAEMRTHQREMRAEMRAQGEDLRKQVEALGEDLRNRLNAQSDQIGLLRERTAHLDGLLEGLREAITMQVPKPVAERPAALPETEPPRRPKRRIDLESEVP